MIFFADVVVDQRSALLVDSIFLLHFDAKIDSILYAMIDSVVAVDHHPFYHQLQMPDLQMTWHKLSKELDSSAFFS